MLVASFSLFMYSRRFGEERAKKKKKRKKKKKKNPHSVHYRCSPIVIEWMIYLMQLLTIHTYNPLTIERAMANIIGMACSSHIAHHQQIFHTRMCGVNYQYEGCSAVLFALLFFFLFFFFFFFIISN